MIPAEPTSEIIESSIIQEPTTKHDNTMDPEPIFSWDKFNEWAGYSESSISDKEFLDNVGIDGSDIPNWVKQNNAKWLKEEKITQEEFVVSLENLKSRGII